MGTWQQFLEKNQTRFLDELCDFIRIPSVSADPNHKDDVSFASRWVAERLKSAGAENVVVMPTEGHPCVYGDWRHAAENQPTILIYGHFDVQPADPYELWTTAPFSPDIRDEKIFGREASDDKGGMLIPILSFEAMMNTDGKLPININFFLKGRKK